MNRNHNLHCKSLLACSLALALSAPALTGCSSGSAAVQPGSGNTTGTTTGTTSKDTNTVLRTASLGTLHGMFATLSSLLLALQAPSRAAQTAHTTSLRLPVLFAASTPTRDTSLTFIPPLNLYDSSSRTGQNFNLNFFSDAAGTKPAGSAVFTLPTSTDTYPYMTSVQFTITGGNYPGTGSGSLTYVTSSVIDITGKLHLNSDSSDAQLSVEQSNGPDGKPVFKGGGSITLPGIAVQLSNFTETQDTTPGATLLSVDLAVPSAGYTGTLSVTDTTLTIQLTSGAKTFKATLPGKDANGNDLTNPTLSITYPDGTQQTIANALTAPAK